MFPVWPLTDVGSRNGTYVRISGEKELTHGDYLFRYALHRVGDVTTAEEMVQETLVAALESIDSFDGRSTVRTWMTSILRFKIADHFRRRPREKPVDMQTLHARVEGLIPGLRPERARAPPCPGPARAPPCPAPTPRVGWLRSETRDHRAFAGRCEAQVRRPRPVR